MDFELRVWREASIAESIEGLLQRIGATVLDELFATALVVRQLVPKDAGVETLAAVRRGALGITSQVHPRATLTAPAFDRVRRWILEGPPLQTSAGRARAPVARELLRGVDDASISSWWLVPLVVDGEAVGVLAVGDWSESTSKAALRRCLAVTEAIGAVFAHQRARLDLARLREAAEAEKDAALARLQVRDIEPAIVGAESGLRGVMEQVERVARTSTPVLILGETGSGKEVVARAIHERSGRGDAPILRVNCGAIPHELVDSELFGHERGSFTGATSQRRGWFERADGGTLFLDEVAELPLAAQVRLLRVLQDGVFERVGGQRPLHVDVRVVAATNRDLEAMVREGTFREDLWYRIHIFIIRLPPLRERHEDIQALAEHFAERAGRRYGAGALRVSAEDLRLLKSYAWPGNVRELAAVIERAAILGDGRRLEISQALGVAGRGDRGPKAREPKVGRGAPLVSLEEAMRAHIERALRECQGRIEGPGGAAHVLRVNPHTLRSKMRKLDIEWSRYRPGGE